MFEIKDNTLQLIKKASKGKKHLKLTIGCLVGDDTFIKIYNENGEMNSYTKYNYEIGSITKTFTISLLSKYLYEHKMALKDPINKYIDGLNKGQYYPDLLRLATHSSGYGATLPINNMEYLKILIGLIRGNGDTKKNNPLDMDFSKMKLLIEKNKLRDKSYSWKYSNFGMSLIGYALGTVTGNGYWDDMNKFIQNELVLTDTYLGTKNNNLHGYDSKNNDCGNWQWNKDNIIASAGAMSSTAEDMLKYAKLNMYNSLPYLSLGHKKYGNGNKKYNMGLGWFMKKDDDNIIFHGGGTGCFSTFLCINKFKKTAAVVLANYTLGINDDEKIAMSLLM